MKKILQSIIIIFLLSGSVNSETVNERLDNIEKRLSIIEENLDSSKLLQGLMGIKEDLDVNITAPTTKLEFKLNGLFCSEGSLFEKINVGYLITNNYEQEIKLVDAYFVAKDLFGDEVFKAKINRGLYLKPKQSKNLQGDVTEGLLGESCAKIKQSRLPDLTVELHVLKIAFGDNSILEFDTNPESQKLDKSKFEKIDLFDSSNIANLLEKSKENMKELDTNNSSLSLTDDEMVAIKTQIYGCWSIPLGLPYQEDLVVDLKIKFNKDGTVKKSEVLNKERLSQEGQGYYKVLADSTLRAIKLCEPFKLPENEYDRWKELIFKFDAKAALGG